MFLLGLHISAGLLASLLGILVLLAWSQDCRTKIREDQKFLASLPKSQRRYTTLLDENGVDDGIGFCFLICFSRLG
jgi:hypothetical protein